MKPQPCLAHMIKESSSLEERAYVLEFVVGSIRSFARKVPSQGFIVALSGGIDSSLVAALACLACGPGFVHGIALPGPFSSEASLLDARTLAKNLGVDCTEASIVAAFDACISELGQASSTELVGFTQENIQARLRMVFAMALANNHDWILLNTGNLSESYLGYSTLYGDMAGAFAPLGGLLKTEVYTLAHTYNELIALKENNPAGFSSIVTEELASGIAALTGKGSIPQSILTKAPSAELAPSQSDEASFGISYSQLDSYLLKRFVRGEHPQDIWDELQVPSSVASKIDARIKAAQFKRALEAEHPVVQRI